MALSRHIASTQPSFAYLSLFSGIGGFEVAISSVFPYATCVGFSEIAVDALSVYRTHFPDHRLLGDVREVTPPSSGIYLVVAGFPCTDLSSAAALRPTGATGLEGDASSLVYEAIRVLRASHAPHFIIENVASMSAANRARVTEELARALPDHTVHVVELNTSSWTGQHRRRVFWTSFPVPLPPEDQRGPLLRTVLLPVEEVTTLAHSERACAYMARRGAHSGRVKWSYCFHSDTASPYSRTMVAALCKNAPYNVLVDRREGLNGAYDLSTYTTPIPRDAVNTEDEVPTHGIIRRFHPMEVERLQVWIGFTNSMFCIALH